MVSVQWPSQVCGSGPCTGQGALCAALLHGPDIVAVCFTYMYFLAHNLNANVNEIASIYVKFIFFLLRTITT